MLDLEFDIDPWRLSSRTLNSFIWQCSLNAWNIYQTIHLLVPGSLKVYVAVTIPQAKTGREWGLVLAIICTSWSVMTNQISSFFRERESVLEGHRLDIPAYHSWFNYLKPTCYVCLWLQWISQWPTASWSTRWSSKFGSKLLLMWPIFHQANSTPS